MTHALLPRSAWTSVPRPVDALTRLDPAQVLGFAVHWPGSSGVWGASPTLQQSAARLEAERRQHTSPSSSDSTKPWTDIAYLAGVDLAGRVFDARGADYRPAANGDCVVNSRYGAVTVLMGEGDTLTQEAIDGVRWWREHEWLPRYPHAVSVVGHRDLHSTDCPGPQLYQCVRSGAFTGHPQEDDDMPTADQIIDRLSDRMQDPRDRAAQAIASVIGSRVWTVGWPAPTPQDPQHADLAQDRLLMASRGTALAGVLDQILGAVRAGTPVHLDQAALDVLADEVAARVGPPPVLDVRALASALVDELAGRRQS